MEKYTIKNMIQLIKLFLCLFKKYSKHYHFEIIFCSSDTFMFSTINAKTLWSDPESSLRYRNKKAFILFLDSNGIIFYKENMKILNKKNTWKK